MPNIESNELNNILKLLSDYNNELNNIKENLDNIDINKNLQLILNIVIF